VARATFLQTNFGRSGADLALVMEQGSAVLMERNAGIERGFVLTQRQLDQAEKLRQNQDDLTDAWAAARMELSIRFLPGLIDWTNELLRGIGATRDAIDPTEELGRRFGGVAGYAAAMGQSTDTATAATRTWVLGMDNALDRLDRLPGSTDPAVDSLDGLTAAWLRNQIMIGMANAEMDKVRDAIAFLVAHPDIHISMTVLQTYLQTGGALAIGGGYSDGHGGMTAAQTAANEWRTAHGYQPMSQADLAAAGYQHGGAFTVGGRGGIDRNLVQFAATRGERVIVQPPAAYPAGPTYNSADNNSRQVNIGQMGMDATNPFAMKRLFDSWLSGG
jgi:hypothetical protein